MFNHSCRLSALTTFHILLGHIHSLARQQLMKMAAHMNLAGNPSTELHGVYHYSRLIGSGGGSRDINGDDFSKFDLALPSAMTQHQVSNWGHSLMTQRTCALFREIIHFSFSLPRCCKPLVSASCSHLVVAVARSLHPDLLPPHFLGTGQISTRWRPQR